MDPWERCGGRGRRDVKVQLRIIILLVLGFCEEKRFRRCGYMNHQSSKGGKCADSDRFEDDVLNCKQRRGSCDTGLCRFPRPRRQMRI